MKEVEKTMSFWALFWGGILLVGIGVVLTKSGIVWGLAVTILGSMMILFEAYLEEKNGGIMRFKHYLFMVFVLWVLGMIVIPFTNPSVSSRITYYNVDQNMISVVCGETQVDEVAANLTTFENILMVDEADYTFWNGSKIRYTKTCTLLVPGIEQ